MKILFYLTGLILTSLCLNAQQTVGLFTQNTGSLDGYVLFAPNSSDTTYLIDKCGYKVHSWASSHLPGQSAYFLEDGSLLRTGSTGNMTFNSGGKGGIIEKFDWNSNLLWSYQISSNTQCQHHDVHQMPNGNVLAIAWELKTPAVATAQGRNPAYIGNNLWSEKIVELQPTGTNTANIVWEWHVWDHLVQDYDSTKPNYGIVAQHPELINLNYYTGTATAADWLHCNGIDYNETLDQIIISSHNFDEVWIIDHSTTMGEAATHSGGTHGIGGDLMYRWGNPAAYGRGTVSDQKFYGQHNPHWIPDGYKDAGNIMIFNNGIQRPGGNYSSVEIFTPPMDSAGNYTLASNLAYLPDSSFWKYTATPANSFYAQNISGAQRLSNGGTIICQGPNGNFFEIDSTKTIVWKYVNPVGQSGIATQGTTPTMNSVFRCYLYEPNYPGFAGQTLIPGNPIEINPLSYNCTMITTGIKNLVESETHVSVMNPFNNEINILPNTDISHASITLLNLQGQIIEEYTEVNLIAKENSILKTNQQLAYGFYYLKIKSGLSNFSFKLIHQ